MAKTHSKEPERNAKHSSHRTAQSASFIQLFPDEAVPYLELMRLDRPAGYFAFYWHYGFGFALGSSVVSKRPDPLGLITLMGYLALWVVVFRGAVCTWNDNIDQDLDRKVARCRSRPIARGAVTTRQGHIFTAVQVAVCAIMLAPFGSATWIFAGLMSLVLGIYPFCKRVMDFPQVVLGFGFAIAIFMCCAIVGFDPLLDASMSDERSAVSLRSGAICLYLASVLWTVAFDTVYAHQDIKDDVNAGVRSLAVRLGRHTKSWLSAMSVVQVCLLLATGYLCDLPLLFYIIGCGGAASALLSMIVLVDLEDPASCAWWFGPGSRLVGASVMLGLSTRYLSQLTLSSVSKGQRT